MPTKRAFTLFIAALIFYFLANQTQVGWLYIFTNSLFGFLAVAFFYARGILKSISLTRCLAIPPESPSSPEFSPSLQALSPPESEPVFHEDDPIQITLQLRQTGFNPVFLLAGQEDCPFAPPADRDQPLFVPTLFKRRPVLLSYQTVCDRRGLYTFSAVSLTSAGPFGLFKASRTVSVPTEILIYPAYYPLKQLRIFEKRLFAERQATRIGQGSLIVGTRDYRAGDSWRQIHWRSTARRDSLVVKEFTADQDQTLTVVLDLAADGMAADKYTPFETAVRLAASLSHYAAKKGVPFRLVASSPSWMPPKMALSRWAAMTYLAKVRNDGAESLAQLLSRPNVLPAGSFTVLLISRPDPAIDEILPGLAAHGRQLLPIFITPDGRLPATAVPNQSAISVSPHNWQNVLAQL